MSFIYKFSLFHFALLSLHAVTAQSQTCYYPDGVTISTDTPCNGAANVSSCCPSDSFCMSSGLCFKDGITSRASCTDKTWDSNECATFCKTTDQSSNVSLTPCNANENIFACGLNNTDCQDDKNTFTMTSGTSLVLRESQLSALLAISEANQGQQYSAGAMAGLGLGLALPLGFALILALLALRKEKQRHGPKLMYKPADEPAIPLSPMQSPNISSLSRAESVHTLNSVNKSYYQNYTYRNPFNPESHLAVPVYEIGSSSPPYSEQERSEVPEKRFSK